LLGSGQSGKSWRRLGLNGLFVNFASAHAGQPAEIQRAHVATQQFVAQWRQPAHPALPIFFGKAFIVVTLMQLPSKQPMRPRLLNRKNSLGFEGTEGLGIEYIFRHTQAMYWSGLWTLTVIEHSLFWCSLWRFLPLNFNCYILRSFCLLKGDELAAEYR
jgi:hypothetical protein